MRPFCKEIESDSNLKNAVIEKIKMAKDWYLKQYQDLSALLEISAYDKFAANIKDDNNNYLKESVENYSNNYSVNCMFSISEMLCRALLSVFSYGPEDPDKNERRKLDGKLYEKHTSWFDYSENIFTVVELLQDMFNENNVDSGINLFVLIEDRGARNSLEHKGSMGICLSSIRFYNVLRQMLIFLEEEYRGILPEFSYPDMNDFSIQSFLSQTNNLKTSQRTTILVCGALDDIPKEQQALLANIRWNAVIDFGGASENGLRSRVKHNQIIDRILTREVARGITLTNAYTEWFKCGEFVNPKHRKDRNQDISEDEKNFPNKTSFYTGDTKKYVSDVMVRFRAIIDSAAELLNPVTIVYMYKDDQLAEGLLRYCEEKLQGGSYTFATVYYWGHDTVKRIAESVYRPYIDEDEDYSELFNVYQCGLPLFFSELEEYKQLIEIQNQSVSKKRLKSDEGMREIPANMALELETWFEVLYENIGEEDYEVAEKKTEEFYHGGIADWSVINNGGVQQLVTNNEYNKWINNIKTVLGKIPEKKSNKIFYIEHVAGIGGSTLLRQIGWSLHKDYPVLLIKKFSRQVEPLLQNLYDTLKNGFVVLVDEDFTSFDELEACIKKIPRACVLIASIRESVSHSKGNQPMKLSGISEKAESLLRQNFKKYSNLTNEQLRAKDAEYSDFVSKDEKMRSPFMIGLYYMDNTFSGVMDYSKKIVNEMRDENEYLAVGLMSMCEIYGNFALPKIIVNRILGYSAREDYLVIRDYAENAFYEPQTGEYGQYKSKHILISQALLSLCNEKINHDLTYQNNLDFWAKKLIDEVLTVEGAELSSTLRSMVEQIFITNRIMDDDESSLTSSYSKLIEDIPLVERKKSVLLYLAEAAERLAKQFDPQEEADLYEMTAHYYGHLGRLCSRYNSDAEEIERYSNLSIEYMEASETEDAIIYHMYAEAKRKIMELEYRSQLDYCDQVSTKDYDHYESAIDEIMNYYEKAAFAGSPDYAGVSEMKLLINYLKQYVYPTKGITTVADMNKLSETQRHYQLMIEDIIDDLDQTELDERAERMFANRIDEYRENIMLGDFSSAITYYQNKLDVLTKQPNSSASDIINARHGLISARIGKYRAQYKRTDYRSYYSKIPAKEVEVILDLLEKSFETGIDLKKYRNRRTLEVNCAHWFNLSRYTSRPIEQGYIVAERWKQAAEYDKVPDPRPYYYLYILDILSVLQGNYNRKHDYYSHLAKCRSLAGEAGYGYSLDRIRDVLVKGKGLGQLLSVKDIPDLGNVFGMSDTSFVELRGNFVRDASEKGYISITAPQALTQIQIEAKFKLHEGNTIGQIHKSHALKFYGGFSYEQVVAINSTVRDITTHEEFAPLSTGKLEHEEKKRRKASKYDEEPRKLRIISRADDTDGTVSTDSAPTEFVDNKAIDVVESLPNCEDVIRFKVRSREKIKGKKGIDIAGVVIVEGKEYPAIVAEGTMSNNQKQRVKIGDEFDAQVTHKTSTHYFVKIKRNNSKES